jgi:pimeloyl-ACP methyl ester carboxylesterase
VLLVHGAWVDGSSWSQVIAILQQRGYRVVSVQLPLTSLAEDVAWTRHVLTERLQGPTVLAGHSYGGAVISGAATGLENVIGLVFASAFAPDEAARSFTDLAGPPAWKTRPSWCLVSTHDQMINPELLRFMAARIGARTVEVPSSHASSASHPDLVARLIRTAARTGTGTR